MPGPYLTWRMLVYNPDRSGANGGLRQTYTNLDRGGLIHRVLTDEGGVARSLPWEWSRAPNGDCLRMRFWGKAEELDIGPRDVIEFQVREPATSGALNAAFCGRVELNPPGRDPDATEYNVYGLRKALKGALLPAGLYSGDAGAIARAVATSGALPPAVLYSSARLADVGASFASYYKPLIPLDLFMDDMAGRVEDLEWGVDAEGYLFMGVPSGEATVPYWAFRSEPYDSSEVVTSVTVNAGGDLFPADARVAMGAGTYRPIPITHTYSAAEHTLYREARKVDASADPFTLDRAGTFSGGLFTNPSNAVDADPATYASAAPASSGSDALQITRATVIHGLEAVLSSTSQSPVYLELEVDASGGNPGNYIARLEPGLKALTRVRMVVPPPEWGGRTPAQWRARVGYSPGAGGGEVRVYDLAGLVLNTAPLEQQARSLIALPAQLPGRHTWRSYVAPVKTVRVTEMPDGAPDELGDASQLDYRLSIEGALETTVHVAPPDAERAARRLRLMAVDQNRR